jgi:hypothetical protein
VGLQFLREGIAEYPYRAHCHPPWSYEFSTYTVLHSCR